MLALIAVFLFLSPVNILLDVFIGIVIVSYGTSGGIHWTRKFLKDMF